MYMYLDWHGNVEVVTSCILFHVCWTCVFSFMARAAELADTLTHIKVSVLSRERQEVSRVCVAVVRG